MNRFPVIGIVGPQASGKTEVASAMVELGAARVRMGNVVWEEVKNRNLELTESNVAKVAEDLRSQEGMSAVAKRCIPIIKEEGRENNSVVVDGIRGIDEVEKFKEEFGEDFILLSVKSSRKTRYERITERKREDDTQDYDSFREKDDRELSWGLKKAIESADYLIENEGSLEDLRKKTFDIFRKVVSKYEG